MSESLGSAVLELDANQGPLDKKLDAAQAATEGRLSSMGKRMKAVGSSLTATGSTLRSRLTLPILAVGAAIVGTGKQFNEVMDQIIGLVGVSHKQIASWERQILQLAPRVGKSPVELAEALYFVASAGFHGQEAMDVLAASAKASTAGLGETKVIADAVTSAINAYGKKNLSAADATDILAGAVKEGKLEASALAPVLGNILPTAAAMKVSFADVAGVLANFSMTGTDAAEGATYLSAVMSALIKPAKEGEDALKGVGLSYSKLREVAGRPGGVIDVMRLLQGRFHGNLEEMAKVIPNVRALRGFMNILAQDGKSVDGVMKGVANSTGLTGRAFKAAAEDDGFKLDQALAMLQATAIRLSRTLIPIVAPAIAAVGKAIASAAIGFQKLPESTQHIVLALVGLAAAAGPVLGIVGTIVTVLGAVVSPAGAVVLVVGLLVAAFVHLYTTSQSFRGAVSNIVGLFASFGAALLPVGTALGGLALKLASLAIGFAGSKAGVMLLGAAVGALVGRMIALGAVWAIGKIAAFAAEIGTLISEVRMAVAAVGAFRAAAMALSATIDGALISTGIGALLVVAGSVVGALMGMSSATDHAKTSADQLTQSLQSQAAAMREVQDIGLEQSQAKANLAAANIAVARSEKRVTELRRHGRKGTLLYREAENQLSQAKIQAARASKEVARSDEVAKEKRQHLSATTREASKHGEERIRTLLDEKSAILDVLQSEKRHAQEAEQAEKENLVSEGYAARFHERAAEAAKDLGTVNKGLARTLDEVGTSTGKVPPKLQALANSLGKIPKSKHVDVEVKDKNTAGKARSIVSRIATVFGALTPKLQGQGGQAMGALRSGIAGKVGAVLATVGALPGLIQGRLSGLGSLLVSAGAALMQGLANGIVSAAESAASAAAAAAQKVASAAKGALGIRSPSRVFEEIGRNVIRGLHNGLSGLGDRFDRDLGTGLVNPLKNAARNIEAILDGIHHQVAALGEASQMVDEIGGLKVEQARAAGEAELVAFEEAVDAAKAEKKTTDEELAALKLAAKGKGSPGGEAVTGAEREAIYAKEQAAQRLGKTISEAEGKRELIENSIAKKVREVEREVAKESREAFKRLLEQQEKEAKELPGHINKLTLEAKGAGVREKRARAAARKEAKKLRSLEHKLQQAKTDQEKAALKSEIKSVKHSLKAAEKAAAKAEKLRSKLGNRIDELKSRLEELVGATGRGGAIFATLMALAKLNAIPVKDLPKFAKGVEGFEGGPAEVGERGPELVGHGIANLAKGVDVLDANLTRRLMSAGRKARGASSAPSGDSQGIDGGVMSRLASAIEGLNETSTVDVLEALVAAVSERQGYKHVRKRRRTAGDGRVAIA